MLGATGPPVEPRRIKAKTYVLDNLIVRVRSDGITPIERTMMKGGEQTASLKGAAISNG